MYGQIFGGAKAMDRPAYRDAYEIGVANGADNAYDVFSKSRYIQRANTGAYNTLANQYHFDKHAERRGRPRKIPRQEEEEEEAKGQGIIGGAARLTPGERARRQSELVRKRLDRADKKNFRARVKENRTGLRNFLKADSLTYKQQKADARNQYLGIQAREDELYGERAGERLGLNYLKKSFSQAVKAMIKTVNDMVAQFKINKLAPRTKVSTLVAAINHPFTAEVKKGARKLVSEGYSYNDALDEAVNNLRRDVHENLEDIKAHPEVQASLDEIVNNIANDTEDFV